MECMKNLRQFQVTFATDCSQLVKMVSEPEEWPAFESYLEDIKLLKGSFLNSDIVHVPRMTNLRQVLAGDGNSPGSIRLIIYGEGSPLVKVSAERIETVDLENKSMTYSIIGGEMLEYYTTFKGTITVTPKGGGSILKWSAEFEKTGHEIEDPHVIKDFAVKNFKEIDEYLLKQSSA